MNILQKHTAQFFGTTRTISRSGKLMYTKRYAAPHASDNSYLGSYADGKQLPAVNYSAQRRNSLQLLDRILYR